MTSLRPIQREPVVWMDKFCIDQTSIADSLMCLPVFLAGCKQLYLFCGPTFWNDYGVCWRFLCIWRWAVASKT